MLSPEAEGASHDIATTFHGQSIVSPYVRRKHSGGVFLKSCDLLHKSCAWAELVPTFLRACGAELWRSQMAAVARILSRRLPAAQSDVETLKTLVMFAGAGLVVSLFLAASGLDISVGFL